MWYWAVAVLALLWTGFAAYDFIMVNVRDAGYLAPFPTQAIDFVDEMPPWDLAAWALDVWGGLLGSVFLLTRSRWAVPAFAVSLAAIAGCMVHLVAGNVPRAITEQPMLATIVAIWVVAIFLLWLACRAWRQGVLR